MKFTAAESTQLAFIARHPKHRKCEDILKQMEGPALEIAKGLIQENYPLSEYHREVVAELQKWAAQFVSTQG